MGSDVNIVDQSVFQNFEYEELKQMLTNAKCSLDGKKVLIEYEIAGRRMSKEYPMPLVNFLSAVNFALQLKDPDSFTQMTGRTLAKFN